MVDDLVLAELERLARVVDERGDIGGEEVLAHADADDERGVASRADDEVRLRAVDRQQGEGAFEPPADRAASASVRSSSASGSSAASRWATTSVSVSEARWTPAAVSSSRSSAKFSMIPLWMTATPAVLGSRAGGRCCRSARRAWPSGCGRSRSSSRACGSLPSRVSRLASLPAFLRTSSVAVADDGDAGGVVSAVLQAPQARHDDLQSLLLTDVSDDSAHEGQPTRGNSRTVLADPSIGSRPVPVGRRTGRARNAPARGIQPHNCPVITVRVCCPTDAVRPGAAGARGHADRQLRAVYPGASQVPAGRRHRGGPAPRGGQRGRRRPHRAGGPGARAAIQLLPVGTWISRTGLRGRGAGHPARAPTQSCGARSSSAPTSESASHLDVRHVHGARDPAGRRSPIVTDSVILVIGAMVLGPEFVPIAALGLGLVRRRPHLFRQALRTLALGFCISIARDRRDRPGREVGRRDHARRHHRRQPPRHVVHLLARTRGPSSSPSSPAPRGALADVGQVGRPRRGVHLGHDHPGVGQHRPRTRLRELARGSGAAWRTSSSTSSAWRSPAGSTLALQQFVWQRVSRSRARRAPRRPAPR